MTSSSSSLVLPSPSSSLFERSMSALVSNFRGHLGEDLALNEVLSNHQQGHYYQQPVTQSLPPSDTSLQHPLSKSISASHVADLISDCASPTHSLTNGSYSSHHRNSAAHDYLGLDLPTSSSPTLLSTAVTLLPHDGILPSAPFIDANTIPVPRSTHRSASDITNPKGSTGLETFRKERAASQPLLLLNSKRPASHTGLSLLSKPAQGAFSDPPLFSPTTQNFFKFAKDIIDVNIPTEYPNASSATNASDMSLVDNGAQSHHRAMDKPQLLQHNLDQQWTQQQNPYLPPVPMSSASMSNGTDAPASTISFGFGAGQVDPALSTAKAMSDVAGPTHMDFGTMSLQQQQQQLNALFRPDTSDAANNPMLQYIVGSFLDSIDTMTPETSLMNNLPESVSNAASGPTKSTQNAYSLEQIQPLNSQLFPTGYRHSLPDIDLQKQHDMSRQFPSVSASFAPIDYHDDMLLLGLDDLPRKTSNPDLCQNSIISNQSIATHHFPEIEPVWHISQPPQQQQFQTTAPFNSGLLSINRTPPIHAGALPSISSNPMNSVAMNGIPANGSGRRFSFLPGQHLPSSEASHHGMSAVALDSGAETVNGVGNGPLPSMQLGPHGQQMVMDSNIYMSDSAGTPNMNDHSNPNIFHQHHLQWKTHPSQHSRLSQGMQSSMESAHNSQHMQVQSQQFQHPQYTLLDSNKRHCSSEITHSPTMAHEALADMSSQKGSVHDLNHSSSVRSNSGGDTLEISDQALSETTSDDRRSGSNGGGAHMLKCTVNGCSRRFSKPASLQTHIQTHSTHGATSKPKPYRCSMCPQTFSRSHDLKRHYYIHSQDKPHTCPRCGKGFSRRDALKRHQRSVLQGKKVHCNPIDPNAPMPTLSDLESDNDD
ncbi:hypothetical protein QVD99_006396 [Batrachochytrium dendrobatidis]|nr:hypothetical protein O5D80_003260 [Batrachochytrium dendrobatidis]KAK5667188.1 hypothetical protein QVD99_006396 [Batrachochytrium dendrobatidis]